MGGDDITHVKTIKPDMLELKTQQELHVSNEVWLHDWKGTLGLVRRHTVLFESFLCKFKS